MMHNDCRYDIIADMNRGNWKELPDNQSQGDYKKWK